jgi:hypothetical protein
LTQERDTLLRTGLYSFDDRVIIIIQKALDLQTQRLRDELLKKERTTVSPPLRGPPKVGQGGSPKPPKAKSAAQRKSASAKSKPKANKPKPNPK